MADSGGNAEPGEVCNFFRKPLKKQNISIFTISGQALPSQSKQREGSPTSTKHKKRGLSLTYKRRPLSFKKGGLRRATRAPYGSLGPHGLTHEPIYKLTDHWPSARSLTSSLQPLAFLPTTFDILFLLLGSNPMCNVYNLYHNENILLRGRSLLFG